MNDFPDIEAALIGAFADLGTCVTVAPPDLDVEIQTKPVVRIERIGGADTRFTDVARISIDVFAKDRATSYSVAETIRQRLLDFPLALTKCTIDEVTTNTGPMEVPWGDANVRRRTASYTVYCRRT